jgi:2-polyprenyl-6-methoxyphenol hydroxylase-like FAD-dependent oxidoreductase
MRDVLVVGAGPVGLTMAAELARHGVRARIIEKLAAPLPYCRAIGVTPRTLEIYAQMGVARAMIDAGLFFEGLRLVGPDGTRDIAPDLSDLPYGPLGIRQSETERILAAHLGGFGIAVEREVSLAALTQAEGGVEVELAHTDGTRERATFAYVVGCDGAHSFVRHALGISFEGDAFPWGFMLAEVELSPPLPRGYALRVLRPREDDAPEMFIAIPLPEPGRYRVSSIAPPEATAAGSDHGLQTERPGPDLAAIQAIADRLMPEPVTLSNLSWSSFFRISMRLAAKYRAGRAFLAGDAAHIHPPTGGQGMNTGIQDAYNLAWKLALVLRGGARESLLDSYEIERRMVGADVVARTTAASVQLGRERAKPHRLEDTQILLTYRGLPTVAEELAEPVPDDAPRAGDRAPEALGLRRDHVSFALRFFEVIAGGAHTLVVYLDAAGDEDFAGLESLATRVKAVAGEEVRVVAIVGSAAAPVQIGAVAILADADGGFRAAYQPAHGTAYLVRPDGYVGYHARPWREDGIAAHLAATLLPG